MTNHKGSESHYRQVTASSVELWEQFQFLGFWNIIWEKFWNFEKFPKPLKFGNFDICCKDMFVNIKMAFKVKKFRITNMFSNVVDEIINSTFILQNASLLLINSSSVSF